MIHSGPVWQRLLLPAVRVLLLGLACGLGLTVPGTAQVPLPGTPQVERQVPMLPDAGIVEISPELRERLGLFPEIAGFRAGRLFTLEGGGAALELEWVEGDRVVRERRILSGAEVDAFRSRLTALMAQGGAPGVFTREGRGGLVLGHTLLGLGYHGWAVPVALDVDSSRGSVAAYLLTAGASFYLPYRLTRGRSVTDTHRNLSLYGGTRGIVSGLLVGDLLAGDGLDGDDPVPARLAGGVALGALGGLAGFAAVDRWGPELGQAELWGAFGDGGLLAGAAVAFLAGPYRDHEVEVRDGDAVYLERRTRNRRLGHLVTLAGQGAGLATGAWLAARRDYDTGDVSVLRSAGVLGMQVGATAARLGGADTGVPYVSGMLAGGVAAVVASDRWIGPQGLSTSEGLLVNAGHLAGAAAALGTTYLLVDDVGSHETALLTASTLGALAGAGLVWRAVAPSARRAPLRGGSASRGPGGMHLRLHPAGILEGWLGERGPRTPGAPGGAAAPTWLTLTF
jgi:hypothetical protein